MQISIKNRIARVDSDFSFYDMEQKCMRLAIGCEDHHDRLLLAAY